MALKWGRVRFLASRTSLFYSMKKHKYPHRFSSMLLTVRQTGMHGHSDYISFDVGGDDYVVLHQGRYYICMCAYKITSHSPGHIYRLTVTPVHIIPTEVAIRMFQVTTCMSCICIWHYKLQVRSPCQPKVQMTSETSVKILWQFAMPDTCENWLGPVNRCVSNARQTHEI